MVQIDLPQQPAGVQETQRDIEWERIKIHRVISGRRRVHSGTIQHELHVRHVPAKARTEFRHFGTMHVVYRTGEHEKERGTDQVRGHQRRRTRLHGCRSNRHGTPASGSELQRGRFQTDNGSRIHQHQFLGNQVFQSKDRTLPVRKQHTGLQSQLRGQRGENQKESSPLFRHGIEHQIITPIYHKYEKQFYKVNNNINIRWINCQNIGNDY